MQVPQCIKVVLFTVLISLKFSCSHVYNDYGFIVALLVQLLQAMYHLYIQLTQFLNRRGIYPYGSPELHKLKYMY